MVVKWKKTHDTDGHFKLYTLEELVQKGEEFNLPNAEHITKRNRHLAEEALTNLFLKFGNVKAKYENSDDESDNDDVLFAANQALGFEKYDKKKSKREGERGRERGTSQVTIRAERKRRKKALNMSTTANTKLLYQDLKKRKREAGGEEVESWLQCDDCKKWRLVSEEMVESKVEVWTCKMNTGSDIFNVCSAPQQIELKDVGGGGRLSLKMVEEQMLGGGGREGGGRAKKRAKKGDGDGDGSDSDGDSERSEIEIDGNSSDEYVPF